MTEHLDVLIVGGGISGVTAAYHLQTRCPGKSFAILEGRGSLGGTWDLFRYPGIRSDSDMHTLGFPFRPWNDPKSIADGPSILQYIRDTAAEFGIDRKIRLHHRVLSAAWSSRHSRWTLEIERGPDAERVQMTCNFLFSCAGYYNYREGHTPEFPGSQLFRGRIVHPQQWTEDIDYKGKRVVVIGSGATAVTLVPALATQAAHVTMLQRSPTYIVARPEHDEVANWLLKKLPASVSHDLVRWKNVVMGIAFFSLCRRAPESIKNLLISGVRAQLPGHDIATHFTPRYKPWDQRLCLVPNGDLFVAIRQGRASVVTDHIETFTEHGIKLRSGKELPADVIVTATGLNMLLAGGVALTVDGERADLSRSMTYKGMMASDVPNMAMAMGYTNASWTLKVDLTCRHMCRLLNYMDRHGFTQCVPRRVDPSVREEPLIDFSSGYVQRALHFLPKQGSKAPWRLYQNYALDLLSLEFGSVRNRALQFSTQRATEPA